MHVGRGLGETVWRAFNSCMGPVTLRLQRVAGGVSAAAWGAGAQWAIEHLPAMFADDDRTDGFDAENFAARAWHPQLRTRAGMLSQRWRPGAVSPLVDHLVASILEQRVTGVEAHRAWRYLAITFGGLAPGPTGEVPAGLYVPPAPDVWQSIPSWQWHRAGVDPKRAATVMRAVHFLRHREPAALTISTGRSSSNLELDPLVNGLSSVPGVGGWTLALVRQAVLGDADAVQFGDFHTCHDVVYALTGVHRADDDVLAEVLLAWAGHRYRVVRLVELAGISAPRRGPRLAPADHRRW